MRDAARAGPERARSAGNAGRHRVEFAGGGTNAARRVEAWVNRQSSSRRRGRFGTARSEGTRELQFARTRGRAAGEVFDRPANFPGRNGQRGTGTGAATEKEPAGAEAGGIAAGGVVRGGHRQDRPDYLGADLSDERGIYPARILRFRSAIGQDVAG